MNRLILLAAVLFSISATAQNYTNIEATEYDPTQNRWLTGNGNRIIAEDADGNLSYFGTGGASHGMEVMNGTLFASASGVIKGYDLITGDEVMSLNIAGAGFINGMGSNPATNTLWVSDFSNNEIIEIDVNDLSAPSYSVAIANTGTTPNGVCYDQINDRVVFVSWGSNASIKGFTPGENTVVSLVPNTGVGNIDGIDMDGSGNFYISSWSPNRITRYSNDFSNPTTISTSGLSNPADISYAVEINTLGIANSSNNTVTFIEFDPTSLDESRAHPYGLALFPNPVEYGSRIAFELTTAQRVNLDVVDLQGRVIQTLMEDQQIAGKHQVLLEGVSLREGQYFLRLTSGDQGDILPFVVLR